MMKMSNRVCLLLVPMIGLTQVAVAEEKLFEAIYSCSYFEGEPMCSVDEDNEYLQKLFGTGGDPARISLEPASRVANLTGLDAIPGAKSNNCNYTGHAEFFYESFDVEAEEDGYAVKVVVKSIQHNSGLTRDSEQVSSGSGDCKPN